MTGVFEIKKKIALQNQKLNLIQNSRKFSDLDFQEEEQQEYSKNTKKTFVKVLDHTNLSLSRLLKFNKENKFLVLNIGDNNFPGGGYLQGIDGEEEELFLCSSLHLSLDTKYYPINDASCVYSPKVLIFRDSCNYSILPEEQRFFIDIITVAPINKPNLTITGHFNEDDYRLTYCKIINIFRFARKNNYKQLLLGGFGCGKYKNNPYDIARIFKEIINGYEFKNVFKDIYFAIPMRTPYFNIFKSILEEN